MVLQHQLCSCTAGMSDGVCAPCETGKFSIFGNGIVILVNTFRHIFRADDE